VIKTYCDMCGKEITSTEYKRFESYAFCRFRPNEKGYPKTGGDLCDSCYQKIEKMFKGVTT